MNAYILISIIVLAVIVLSLFVVLRARSTARLTPLAGLAFAFVLAGILFGENQLLGYSLLGVGVVLAAIDIGLGFRRK